MWRQLLWLCVLLIGSLSCGFAAASFITPILQRAPVLDPNLTAFPDSSLIDASARLDAPAGKHGFLSVQHGRFAFADGKRQRFFGVNLAKESVFIDHARIDALAALFARAGINLVRIHHIDDSQGILSTEPGQYFNWTRLDQLDYWVAKLKERGIYLALDLDDYRTFRADEGVKNGEALGRGAKPYAVFNPRLIELQLDYARQLLREHINPYTRLAYADDPAVAFLEIYDENGLFIRRGDWPNLRQPYRADLQREWNAWLRARYGSTQTLRNAWTNRSGASGLLPNENIEDGTVQLPRMELDTAITLKASTPLLNPARVSSGAQFAADIQEKYLRTMTTELHKMGVKIPITAVGAQDILPDLITTANTCDYIGINFYWDHPLWDPGRDWTLPAYFAQNNPLMDNPNYSFPVTVSQARMAGKPLVVRELGYCYPNPYRGVGMVEAAAYGALLDVDALILFTYGADEKTRTVGFFDIHLDPLRWGLVTQASRLFLSGEIKPSVATVGIGYSDVDAFTWYNYFNPLTLLSFTSRIENYTNTGPHPYDLLVASGRSCGAAWQGERLLLFANNPHTDLQYQGTATGLDEQMGYHLRTGRNGEFPFTFNGMGYNAGTLQTAQAWPVYALEDLMAKGFLPIASAETAALGFLDPSRKLIGFHNLHPDIVTRVALDALHAWSNIPVSHTDLDANRRLSDTLQLTRYLSPQLLRVDSPTLQALAGRMESGSALNTSVIHLSTPTTVGTFTAESLDGAALPDSGAVLVKMTSVARNDMVQLAPAPNGPKPQRLTTLGVAPIRSDGHANSTPTRVELGSKLLIELYLQNGNWEYLVERERALLYLDTGNITVNLPAQPREVRWYTGNTVISAKPESSRFTIPNCIRLTEFIW